MEQQIIIVAADIQFRDALKLACYGPDIAIEAVPSVQTAFEQAERSAVRVVITDSTVDELDDGIQLARALHGKHPGMTCFLMVEDDSSSAIDSIANEIWVQIIHKPVQMLQFSAAVYDAVV